MVRRRRHAALAGRPRLAAADARSRRPTAGRVPRAGETGRHRWLAWDQGTAAGYIDCGTYDRWATWEGGPGGRGVIGTIDVPTGSISYVVDPALRRRGYCTAMVGAVLVMPELEHVQLFAAGVEPANTGSAGCLRKVGFEPLDPEPDWEGVVYYARLRHPGTPGGPDAPGQPPR